MAVGSKVSLFKEGDEVVTLFNQGHIGGSLDHNSLQTGLGGVIDGTLRQYGAFDEHGVVHKPKNLSHVEAATLSCAGLTAWNALYGLKVVKAGDYVLTQGTGGVSIFALQVRFFLSPPRTLPAHFMPVRQSRRRKGHLHHIVRRQGRGPQEARRRPCHQLQGDARVGRRRS